MNSRYVKKSSESQFEYVLRLVTYRMEENPKDLNWEDIVVYSGIDISPESLRKSSQGEFGGYAIFKYLNEKYLKISAEEISEEIIEKYENLILEFEKEKIKARDQKREYRKMVREVSRAEYLKEHMEYTAQIIAKENPLVFKKGHVNIVSDNEAIAMIGDFHFGMEVDNFLNTYNRKVFVERLQLYMNEIIEYCNLFGIQRLHLIDIGDNISGIIHNTTRLLNNEDVITQIQIVAEVFAQCFTYLCENIDEVVYYSVLDNHSRISPNKNDSIDKESFARLVPWFLEPRMKDIENFIIQKNDIDDDIVIFDVLGYTCFAVHGHKDSPNNVVADLTLMTKMHPDYIFMGHYHRSYEDNNHGIFVIGNPSGIGVDDYSKNRRLTGQAQQKMVIINKAKGRFATFNITLQ